MKNNLFAHFLLHHFFTLNFKCFSHSIITVSESVLQEDFETVRAQGKGETMFDKNCIKNEVWDANKNIIVAMRIQT